MDLRRHLTFKESPPSPVSTASFQSRSSFRRSRDLSEWQLEDVGEFLQRLDLENYIGAFQRADVDGQTLLFLDHESLKDLGVASVGVRLRILKAVYEIKLGNGMPLDDDDWLPAGVQPCTGCDQRLSELEKSNELLQNDIEALRVVVNALLPQRRDAKTNYLNGRKPSLTVNTKRQRAGRPTSLTPTASAPRGGQDLSGMPTGVILPVQTATPKDESTRKDYFDNHNSSNSDPTPPISPYEQPRSAGGNIPDTPIAKVRTMEDGAESPRKGAGQKTSQDTCLQVLPAACKKYGLKHPWETYCMIVTTPKGNPRALAFDERPRQIVHDLRSQGERPSCLVQHQSELRSPLALSAARKAKLFRRYIDGSVGGAVTVPLQILPIMEHGRTLSDDMRERLPPVAKFAFAIYSWMAEGDGDTDAIEYGDCFMVADKRDGWLEVQRVAEGETGSAHIKIPINVALQMFTLPTSRPMQPRVIDVNMLAAQYTTSQALIDRPTNVDGELDLAKGDRVRIYARASHWCFCIRLNTCTAGWVPSWILSTSSATQTSISPLRK